MKSIFYFILLYIKYCNGNFIQEVEFYEYFGLIFLIKCYWNDYLDIIIVKVLRFNIFWKNKYLFNCRFQELLVLWYFFYVCLLFEYVDIIWKYICYQIN